MHDVEWRYATDDNGQPVAHIVESDRGVCGAAVLHENLIWAPPFPPSRDMCPACIRIKVGRYADG